MADRVKLTIYPSPRSLEILGRSAPALNQAVECWAQVIAEASADNDASMNRDEWQYLSDLLSNAVNDPAASAPGELLASAVHDGNRLEELGEKWFKQRPQERVRALVGKLRAMDYAHAWAVIIAVQWFWDNHSAFELSDPWWTIAFRRGFSAVEVG